MCTNDTQNDVRCENIDEKYNWRDIGARIRELRGKTTQKDFAVRLGYGVDYDKRIGKWENGNLRPGLDNLIQMCRLFECDLEWLLCSPEYDCKTRGDTFIKRLRGYQRKRYNA